MKINIIKIFCVIVFLLITACSEDENVIAEFGDEKITLDEFKIAYLDVIKKPDVYDSKKLREEFLDELINTRILANEANRQKFQIGEKLQLRIDAYINKTLRTAHFDSIIRPKFSIEESNIEEAYLYTQEERNISHLFFTSSKQADEFHSRLKQGESFSNLAQEIFGESELGKSGGELGWVKWDQFEYDLAMTAF
ncbi:MAG: peptidylprolyl isomerase, partial [Melioribacteraceae bacterium]|nr:peptidylprolyl isomerase [Melioribacteraceae bacterium]